MAAFRSPEVRSSIMQVSAEQHILASGSFCLSHTMQMTHKIIPFAENALRRDIDALFDILLWSLQHAMDCLRWLRNRTQHKHQVNFIMGYNCACGAVILTLIEVVYYFRL